ncbi:hypothetical protein GCK72_005753 [Caenorhabditis remanei]|uniref:ShKT domain-containing protein n=1 Tax=Caenorhabditis remanei TaxID=31234 RepID=A0A6A5HDG1_CAERE|nr:hypothetical protein GCK72_005753 [Caenorhabditis remanei]KAF1765800.1 hypothetical protein GCK72_005753 [Caenorhabditis remanei]
MYQSFLDVFCPKTCGLCPGNTTVAPPTAAPNCVDTNINCKAWVKEGYCTACFVDCSDRVKNCAKSCGFCVEGSCLNYDYKTYAESHVLIRKTAQMIRHSLFLIFSVSFLLLVSCEYFEDTKCENDPTVDCDSFKDDCKNDKLIPLLKKSCPVTCNLCPSTVSPTTLGPCEDSPGSNCSTFKDYCDNEKYIPMLKEFCPVTCNMCPGATTVSPPTPNPHCYDNETKCKEWKARGYCTNCFYSCADKIKMCAKTCGFCTKGTCVDCKK